MIRTLYYAPDKGPGSPAVLELPALLAQSRGLLWVDLDSPTPEESKILEEVFNFHPLAIEDCLSPAQAPKIEDYGQYFYMVIHGVNANVTQDQFETLELDIFLGKHYVVTFHQQPSRSISANWERCQKNPQIMAKDAEFLLHRIIDNLVENYLPIMDEIGDKVEEVEKEIFANPSRDTLSKIFVLKKDILYLRRIVHPQREVVHRLSGGEFKEICYECTLLYRDVYDHLFMISELTETYRDAVSGALEIYLSVVSNRLNEVMKLLTIIATIMMPLTLISGIFGMNFERIPLLKNPLGFAVIMGIMGIIALTMLWFFIRKKWL